jgi:uncharacterized membrane protein YphA (DoxX/SURF4 family)
MNNPKLVLLLLRIGLAAVYLYAGTSSILYPNEWIGFLPHFISFFVPAATALFCIALSQVVLSLWLISGFKTFYAAVLAAVMIFGIIIFNLNALIVTFRDISIFLTSVALAIGTYKKTQN